MTFHGTDGRLVRPSTITLWTLRRWAASRLGSIRHERQVSRIAAALVRVTGPLHQLTPHQRRLLRMAAYVHDVGRAKDDAKHPQVGAAMILANASLPLSKSTRRALAYLTLYHRGQVPQAGEDVILKAGDDHDGLLRVLAFLRAADVFDSRSLGSPRLTLSLRGRRLRITCRVQDDTPKARKAFDKPKKFRLLEELLGCEVEVRIRRARNLELAA